MDRGSLGLAPSPGRHLRAELTSRPHRDGVLSICSLLQPFIQQEGTTASKLEHVLCTYTTRIIWRPQVFPRLEGFCRVMKMVVFGMVQWILCLVSALSLGEGGTAAFELKSSALPAEHNLMLVFVEILLKAPVVFLYGRVTQSSSPVLLRTRRCPWAGQVFSRDFGGVGERSFFQQK